MKSRKEALVDSFGENGNIYLFSFEGFLNNFIRFVSRVGQIIEFLLVQELSHTHTVVQGFVFEPLT